MLYRHAYCCNFRTPLDSGTPVEAPDGELVEALSAANAGRDQWQGGWIVLPAPLGTPEGQILLGRGHERRLVPTGEIRPPRLGVVAPFVEPPPGSTVELRLPREGRTVQRGFYFAFGDGGGPVTLRRVRLYWHLAPAGAIALMAALTPRLHRFSIPFQLKCPDHPALYGRHDTAVLIVDHRHFPLTLELVAELLPGLRPHLGPSVPLFTRPLVPGLGFAEDPGGGASFGMHRCGLVAEALWDAHRRGADSPVEKMQRVLATFREAGLDPHRPHLRSPLDLYSFAALETVPDGL
jgi:hypothetical protein